MSDVYKITDGGKEKITLRRMFGTHGPYLMNDQRLDQLTNVKILLDSSTTTSTRSGSSSSKKNISSVIGRGVVGGVLGGGVGAIIGGVTGKGSQTIEAKTSQNVNVNLTVELYFENADSVYVSVRDQSTYEILLAQLKCEPLSEHQLEEMKELARTTKMEIVNTLCRRMQADELMPDFLYRKLGRHVGATLSWRGSMSSRSYVVSYEGQEFRFKNAKQMHRWFIENIAPAVEN